MGSAGGSLDDCEEQVAFCRLWIEANAHERQRLGVLIGKKTNDLLKSSISAADVAGACQLCENRDPQNVSAARISAKKIVIKSPVDKIPNLQLLIQPLAAQAEGRAAFGLFLRFPGVSLQSCGVRALLLRPVRIEKYGISARPVYIFEGDLRRFE